MHKIGDVVYFILAERKKCLHCQNSVDDLKFSICRGVVNSSRKTETAILKRVEQRMCDCDTECLCLPATFVCLGESPEKVIETTELYITMLPENFKLKEKIPSWTKFDVFLMRDSNLYTTKKLAQKALDEKNFLPVLRLKNEVIGAPLPMFPVLSKDDK